MRRPDPLVLIEIAQKDLEATCVLFERGLYSQAIYMLQQSLEKAIKASLLRLGIIGSEEELKEGMGRVATKRILHLLASVVLEQPVAFLAEILKRCESKEQEQEEVLETLAEAVSHYEAFLKMEAEVFKVAYREVGKRAFSRATRKERELLRRHIEKASYFMIPPLFFPEDMQAMCLGSSNLSNPSESEKAFNELVTRISLALMTSLLLMFHVPFELPNMDVLRYEMKPEELGEEVVVVSWGKNVAELLKKTELLKILGKGIEKGFGDPEVRKLLELAHQILS